MVSVVMLNVLAVQHLNNTRVTKLGNFLPIGLLWMTILSNILGYFLLGQFFYFFT